MDMYDVDSARSRDHNHYGSKNSVYEDDMHMPRKDQSSRSHHRHKKVDKQLYVPRSGDCRVDSDRHQNSAPRSDNSSQSYNRRAPSNRNDRHGINNSHSRGNPARNDRSFMDSRNKDVPNSDVNYNRNFRQASEPRSSSPTQGIQELNIADRNRDSRSMEPSRHIPGTGGKPPSGRRNSAGYASDTPRLKYMLNIENLPPRLRKKYLEQSGQHSLDTADPYNKEQSNVHHSTTHASYNNHVPAYNSGPSWSQTLPSRGRGRLRENESFDRDKYISTYLKHHDSSRRSTPSSSYMNLYEPNSMDNMELLLAKDNIAQHQESFTKSVSRNGFSDVPHSIETEVQAKQESDSEPISSSSTYQVEMTLLDWTEEVEKNIILDDIDDSTTSSPTQNIKSTPVSQDTRQTECKPKESKEAKRSGRSKRRDKRSSSRGHRNEKKSERNRKDSFQNEPPPSNIKLKERERRDSHRSNRSSTIGNSRDDLDRWRSLRSFSREPSAEGRIVSQCNSRDPSGNRAISPRDHEGFKVPQAVSKNSTWTSNQKKNNGAFSGRRTPSIDRNRQSPAPANANGGGLSSVPNGGNEGGGGGGGGGGGRRTRGRGGARKRRNAAENAAAAAPPAPAPHTHTMTGASSATTNWREEIIESKKHGAHDNRHHEANRKRLNSGQSEKSLSDSSASHPGLLVLPQGSMTHLHKEQPRAGSMETQKILFDHQNPSKPIIVQTSYSKGDGRMDRGSSDAWGRGGGGGVTGDVSGATGDAARAVRHRPLLQEVDRADAILQTHALSGPLGLAAHWRDVAETRKFLQGALQKLLLSDLKYCQADNTEHHFWKILYYTFIEVLRKSLPQLSAEDKPKIVQLINTIIEEGNVYFENLIQLLEKAYKFNAEDFINGNHLLPPKGLGYVGLALISVQKLYVFLGDLARYKEQVNETNNYARSKLWYTKAQQINPKNGRPYNQLAILAIYARRKLDAVYYYMRSLMSSNAFHSARESLISLFDENRKKYETAERKRRAAIESANKENGETHTETGKGLRKEIWVRPSGGRTTTLRHDTRDDYLANMSTVELNKSFITSYLHVHGKLVTKIGMETFHECAALMLRQFRALLQQQPLPTGSTRLLQLTALNMFAVESSSGRDTVAGERSVWLECALGVSLLMFGALLERCCALLPEPAQTQQHCDALQLLPAIKVWSDWMLCHSSVWNPPPSLDSFDIGMDSDPWDWLAKLMNILEALDDKAIEFESEMKEGYEAVRLSEDTALAGFTPLMYMEPSGAFVSARDTLAPHLAEHALRTKKLLFFGTEYLVGVEPPVLRLEYPADAAPRYVSAVKCAQPHHLPLQDLSEDSEEESEETTPRGATSDGASVAASLAASGAGSGAEGADEATRRLLRRKEQLESRRANMERRKARMQELLRGGWVSVEVEVRPRWLVPDTNCFIDQLPLLLRVVAAPSQPYLLAVPLVVVTELEGLCKCARVGANAAAALSWLSAAGGGGGVRFATSRGSLLASRAFTAEREQPRATNDDRVLATALSLHENMASEPDESGEGAAGAERRCVRRVREVLLLTDDRNLRVKAIAAELPARDLPSFVQWAALPDAHTSLQTIAESPKPVGQQ